MKIKYRSMDIWDADFLAWYAAECGAITKTDEKRKIKRRLRKRFRDPNYAGAIAFDGDMRIGFQDGLIKGDGLDLNEIYVKSRYRSCGVGLRLLQEIINSAKSRGVKKIVFHTEPDNLSMQRLAKKSGFELHSLKYLKEL